ncbi:MAG: tyrosine-type recombinase/integrase [Pyrinomonadaceae bacterium]
MQTGVCLREPFWQTISSDFPYHLHKKLREDLPLPKDCVIHSLRHTFLIRFGEAGADAFTIKKVAGHSSVTISERYLHPTGRAGARLRASR